LLLQRFQVVAIVPPSLHHTNDIERGPLADETVLRAWVRGGLLVIAVGLLAVFVIAVWLRPYDAEGRSLTMETHRQLGLPPCQFYFVTGLPCPSCGMTTSFALLMHGDLKNSVRANAVGTLLACFCLLLIPWCLASAIRRRLFFIQSLERAVTWFAVVFLGLMLFRWVIVLAIFWNSRTGS
jgi:hypothetical protein